MKRFVLFIGLFAFLQINLFAQLSINSSNWKTGSGQDSIAIINPNSLYQYISEPKSFEGEQKSWLLDIDATGMFYENYKPVTNQSFSTANYYIDSLFDVLAYNRGVYRKDYYLKNDNGLQVLGYEYDAQSYFIGDLTFGPNDSISVDNYSKVYDKLFQVYKFPISSGYSHQDSYIRDLNTRITVAAFVLNNALASKRSYVTLKDSVVGWGDMNIVIANFESGKRDVLVLKREISITDSIFLNNMPAPPAFLGAFNLEQGVETKIYRYIVLTKDLSSPLLVITCEDENMNSLTSANVNVGGFKLMTDVEDNNLESNISIYPNPTSDFINIDFENIVNPSSIKITNSLGSAVIEYNSNQISSGLNRIDVSNLESGVYFIKIDNKVSKFIKY